MYLSVVGVCCLLVGCAWLFFLCPQVPYRCSCWAVWGCWRWCQVAIRGQLSCCPATAPETPGHSWGVARGCTDGAAPSAGRRPARMTSSPVSVCVWMCVCMQVLGSFENVQYCVRYKNNMLPDFVQCSKSLFSNIDFVSPSLHWCVGYCRSHIMW